MVDGNTYHLRTAEEILDNGNQMSWCVTEQGLRVLRFRSHLLFVVAVGVIHIAPQVFFVLVR